MEKETKLGLKVFYYHLSKRLLFGIALLVFAFICLLVKESVLIKILFFLPLKTATGIVSMSITFVFFTSLAFLMGGIVLAWIRYISCTFTLDEYAISIRRGIFSKKEISIPYRQIQNVNIEQSFAKRMMGVCKLIIQTAGNDNNDQEGEDAGIFDIISFNLAEEVKAKLLQKNNGVNVTNNPETKETENNLNPETTI